MPIDHFPCTNSDATTVTPWVNSSEEKKTSAAQKATSAVQPKSLSEQELKADLSQMEEEIQRLRNELELASKALAQPSEMGKEIERLRNELAKEQEKNARLEDRNAHLSAGIFRLFEKKNPVKEAGVKPGHGRALSKP